MASCRGERSSWCALAAGRHFPTKSKSLALLASPTDTLGAEQPATRAARWQPRQNTRVLEASLRRAVPSPIDPGVNMYAVVATPRSRVTFAAAVLVAAAALF